jgi:hypothetical protein
MALKALYIRVLALDRLIKSAMSRYCASLPATGELKTRSNPEPPVVELVVDDGFFDDMVFLEDIVFRV